MTAGTWPFHGSRKGHFKWPHTIHDRARALGLATVTAGGVDWSRDPSRTAAFFFSPKLIATLHLQRFAPSLSRYCVTQRKHEVHEPSDCSARHLIEYVFQVLANFDTPY